MIFLCVWFFFKFLLLVIVLFLLFAFSFVTKVFKSALSFLSRTAFHSCVMFPILWLEKLALVRRVEEKHRPASPIVCP